MGDSGQSETLICAGADVRALFSDVDRFEKGFGSKSDVVLLLEELYMDDTASKIRTAGGRSICPA